LEERDKGPERLGEILSRVLKESGLLSERGQRSVEEAWQTVAGPTVAGHTRVIGLRSGRLTVGVDSAPLRQELELFRKEELTKALRELLAGVFVEELRFRLL
jgi:predicted nucleic acid-binding Zn ribbon protein